MMPIANEHDGETTTEGLPEKTHYGNFHAPQEKPDAE